MDESVDLFMDDTYHSYISAEFVAYRTSTKTLITEQ